MYSWIHNRILQANLMVDLVESRKQITHVVPFVATSKDNNKSSLIEQEFEPQNPLTLQYIVIQIQGS
jgi:hypothetical protein